MTDETRDMIVIKDLYKHFGQVKALNGVSLTVKKGKVVVVIGPSGSGKSTMLRCINHLETPTGGEIWIDGVKMGRNEKSSTKHAPKSAWSSSFSIFSRT